MIQLQFTGNTLEEVFASALKAHDEFKRLTTDGKTIDVTPKKETATRTKKTAATGAPNDPIPNLTKTSDNADAAVETKFTADDIRKRVQAITDNAQKRGLEMPQAIVYVKTLFGKFGMKKVSDLAEDKYADFMKKSEAFLKEGAE